MTYQILVRPIGPNGQGQEQVTDADGNKFDQQVVTTCPAMPEGNILRVIHDISSSAIQPSAAQYGGLNGYIAMIQAEQDTSDIETLISSLAP